MLKNIFATIGVIAVAMKIYEFYQEQVAQGIRDGVAEELMRQNRKTQ